MPPTSPERPFGVAEPTNPVRHEPSLFASSIEEPRPRSGVSIWLAAAAALVIGIGIGFASGYRAGKGSTSVAATATENPAATFGEASGQPFSESSVQEPVKLNPEPIVPAPEKPAGPLRGQPSVARPALQPQTEGRPVAAAVGRVSPRAHASVADPSTPVTGPASLQVVSRPSGAQVILDGRGIGRTPITIADVTSGDHNIRLELSGFKGWATTVDVKAGGVARVAASLEQ